MKTYQITQDELTQLNKELEHTEHAVCMVTTIITLLVSSETFYGTGRSMQIGLTEAINELEELCNSLETRILQISRVEAVSC